MNKLALVGGSEIAKYTVADIMWKHIADVSGVDFSFEIIALATEQETSKFYESYIGDESFIGFNVALPWKQQFGKYVAGEESGNPPSIINTVYKRSHTVHGLNTDPIGIARGLSGYSLQGKNVLILGAGGGGQSTAHHLTRELGATVYMHDIVDNSAAFAEVQAQKYDLIINATPLGKFYFDQPIEAFSSPVDIVTLKKISHHDTIMQEMNYFPLRTFFLQLGEVLGLRTVSGEQMLVYQALESFRHYFAKEIKSQQAQAVIERMQKHIQEQESAILGYGYQR
jgi:shikimate 5-dehydrogenase